MAADPVVMELTKAAVQAVLGGTVIAVVLRYLIQRRQLIQDEKAREFEDYKQGVDELLNRYREDIKEMSSRHAFEVGENRGKIQRLEKDNVECVEREKALGLQLVNMQHTFERQVERMSERLSRYERMFKVAVVSCSEDSVIASWNEAATMLFGYKADEVVGRERIEILIPNSLRDAHDRAFRAALLDIGPPRAVNIRRQSAIRKDGDLVTVDISLSGHTTPIGGKIFVAQIKESEY